jgi:DNA-binding response OmpR family regulator
VGEPFPEVRGLLERVLEELGHVPVPHRRGWQERLPEVDVLILEPALEDGVALAHALRETKPELPVICTGTGPPAHEVRALRPVAYLPKPFAVAELEQALRGAIDRARQA